MIVVRYATLAALVLWLAVLLPVRFADLLRHVPALAIGCGVVVMIGLFAMKFMGPPPPSFVPRAAIVFVMLAMTVWSAWHGAAAVSSALVTLNIGLGFLLLFWYTRE